MSRISSWRAWMSFTMRGDSSVPWWRALIIALVLTLAAIYVVQWQPAYRLGFVTGEYRCLEPVAFLIDRTRPSRIERGMYVVFEAQGLQPIPDGLPLVKIAAAVAGDAVRVEADILYINGQRWGALDLHQTLSFAAGAYDRFIIIPDGELFVLGTEPGSFDSRYYGTVSQEDIHGTATALF